MFTPQMQREERSSLHWQPVTAVELEKVQGGGFWFGLGLVLTVVAVGVICANPGAFNAGFMAQTDENGKPIGPGGFPDNTPRM